MTDETENLVLTQLRAMRNENKTRHDIVLGSLRELTARVSSLEVQVAHMHADMAGVHVRLDNLTGRVERVERRVELREES